MRQAAADQEQAAALPFIGVTTDGVPIAGLFPIRATGVSVHSGRLAAEAFLDSLQPAQRQPVVLPVESEAWRQWVATGLLLPDALAFSAMTGTQRQRALALLEASLSPRGMTEVMNVMQLNQSQVELTRDIIPNEMRPHPFGQWSYWLSFMGVPDAKEPWGWQIEGHHLVLNYFVIGDQVVMTPAFLGAEPARATVGQFAGTAALQDEQRKGWTLFTALSPQQQIRATIRTAKNGDEGVAGAFQDNLVLDYAGIGASELSGAQRTLLPGSDRGIRRECP